MTTPAYPGYGQRCNGCGLCCLDQPCPIAVKHRLWKEGKCNALQQSEGVYRCGMMITPDKFSKFVRRQEREIVARDIRIILGSGSYCDARITDHLGRIVR